MLVLADAPGPAGNVDAHASSFSHNQKACPGDDEDGTPPLSGLGVAILGGHDIRLTGNTISDNAPTGPTFVSAGVAIVIGDSGTVPKNISIHGNKMSGNSQDVFSDGSAVNLKASGNELKMLGGNGRSTLVSPRSSEREWSSAPVAGCSRGS